MGAEETCREIFRLSTLSIYHSPLRDCDHTSLILIFLFYTFLVYALSLLCVVLLPHPISSYTITHAITRAPSCRGLEKTLTRINYHRLQIAVVFSHFQIKLYIVTIRNSLTRDTFDKRMFESNFKLYSSLFFTTRRLKLNFYKFSTQMFANRLNSIVNNVHARA